MHSIGGNNMYTFRKVSDRMLHLHQRIRDRVIRFDSERARIITESDKKWGMAIPHIRRAKKFDKIARFEEYIKLYEQKKSQ